MKWLLLLVPMLSIGQELIVEKPDFNSGALTLKIVRAYPESFETYLLTNSNGRDVRMVCANNRAYDNNPVPFLRYQNFYGERVDFALNSEKVCREMGRYIELVQAAVDEDNPFWIQIDKRLGSVSKIEYPNLDPYAESGDVQDLLPKKRIRIFKPETRPKRLL